jgi:hypothetical protein
VGLWLAGCRSRPAIDPVPWDADGDGVVRVRILGDSNSSPLDRHIWWYQVQALLEADAPGRWKFGGKPLLGAVIGPNPKNAYTGGRWQVDEALAARPAPDLVILAFGTNDLAGGRDPTMVAGDYALAVRSFVHAGIRVLLAYTPPCWNRRCNLDAIQALNRRLDADWPTIPKVDFFTGFVPADLTPDGMHFTPAGHTKRRDALLRLLRAGAGSRQDASRTPSKPAARARLQSAIGRA